MTEKKARETNDTVFGNFKFLTEENTTLPITFLKYLIDIVAGTVDCIKLVQMMESRHFSTERKCETFASRFLKIT